MSDPGRVAAAVAARGAWRDLGSALMMFLAMPLVAVAAMAAVFGVDRGADGGEWDVGQALTGQFVGSLVVVLVALRLRPAAPLGSGVAAAALRYLLFLVGFVPVAFLLLPWLWQAAGLPLDPQEHLVWFLEESPLGLWLLGLTTVTFVGPLFEEVVFRGYLLRGLRHFGGDASAVWSSAFLFGLAHAGSGWFLVLPLTLLGAFLGWLRLRYRGLAAPFAVHVLHNALVLGFTLAVPQSVDAVYGQGG